MLGTGFEGSPRDPADAVILAINAARARVIAADVPSGVNASTGEVEGSAVRAVATATFHQAKPGLWIHPGKAHAGVVEVVDIGIPTGAPGEAEIGLIGGGVLFEMPRRTADSTKFSSGNVFIIGGSHGLTGAPSMAALAAMRAGAGYVTVGAPQSLELSFTVRLLEAMMVGLPERDGVADADRAPAGARGDRPRRRRRARPRASARTRARRSSRASWWSASTCRWWSTPTGSTRSPAARWRSYVRVRAAGRRCMTPHAGELGRHARASTPRRSAGTACATRARPPPRRRRSSCSRATTRWWRRPTAASRCRAASAPALATAGTGDVLSGVIGAMLAKGLRARARRLRRRLRAPARGPDRRRARRARRRDRLRRDPRAARRPGKLEARWR